MLVDIAVWLATHAAGAWVKYWYGAPPYSDL